MIKSAGDMRHRVTVQEKTVATNARGERTESWADLYANVPAHVRFLTSRELQAANARQSEAVVSFEFWSVNVPDLSAEHRILYSTDTYELDPPTQYGTHLEFTAVKGSRGPTDG